MRERIGGDKEKLKKNGLTGKGNRSDKERQKRVWKKRVERGKR